MLVGAPVVALSGVRKVFSSGGRQVVAVAGIDLTVGAGEIVAVLGPNGAGNPTSG